MKKFTTILMAMCVVCIYAKSCIAVEWIQILPSDFADRIGLYVYSSSVRKEGNFIYASEKKVPTSSDTKKAMFQGLKGQVSYSINEMEYDTEHNTYKFLSTAYYNKTGKLIARFGKDNTSSRIMPDTIVAYACEFYKSQLSKLKSAMQKDANDYATGIAEFLKQGNVENFKRTAINEIEAKYRKDGSVLLLDSGQTKQNGKFINYRIVKGNICNYRFDYIIDENAKTVTVTISALGAGVKATASSKYADYWEDMCKDAYGYWLIAPSSIEDNGDSYTIRVKLIPTSNEQKNMLGKKVDFTIFYFEFQKAKPLYRTKLVAVQFVDGTGLLNDSVNRWEDITKDSIAEIIFNRIQ